MNDLLCRNLFYLFSIWEPVLSGDVGLYGIYKYLYQIYYFKSRSSLQSSILIPCICITKQSFIAATPSPTLMCQTARPFQPKSRPLAWTSVSCARDLIRHCNKIGFRSCRSRKVRSAGRRTAWNQIRNSIDPPSPLKSTIEENTHTDNPGPNRWEHKNLTLVPRPGHMIVGSFPKQRCWSSLISFFHVQKLILLALQEFW